LGLFYPSKIKRLLPFLVGKAGVVGRDFGNPHYYCITIMPGNMPTCFL